MKTDISYSQDPFFITLFPNNPRATRLCAEVFEEFGGFKFPTALKANVFAQIKSAGYSIRKVKASKKGNAELLATLGV